MASFSFTDWVEFTFGLGRYSRPLAGAFPGSAQEALQHCIRFFENSWAIVSAVPRPNATAALEDMPSIDGYGGLLSCRDLPPADRLRLADSQYALFRDTFCKDSFEFSAFLWWERLIGAEWNDGPPVRRDIAVCDWTVEVLIRILSLNCEKCVESALHGLSDFVPNSSNSGSLRAIVEDFMASHPALSKDLRLYAIEVAAGRAR